MRITMDFAQKVSEPSAPGGFRASFGLGDPQRSPQPTALAQQLRDPFRLPHESGNKTERKCDDEGDAQRSCNTGERQFDLDMRGIHRADEQCQQSHSDEHGDEEDT